MLDTRNRSSWPAAPPASRSRLTRLADRAWRAAKRAAWRAAKATARAGWRQRRRLAPVYAAAVVWVIGAVLSLPGDGHRTALVLAGLCTGTGGVWWWWTCRRSGRRWGRRRQAYVLLAWGVAWAWIITASVVGPGPPMLGYLQAATLGFGVIWWHHHRIRPIPPVDRAVALWQATVASSGGGALPDSWITAPEPVTYQPPVDCDPCQGHGETPAVEDSGDGLDVALDDPVQPCGQCNGAGKVPGRAQEVGIRFLVNLPPGKLTTKSAIQATERVASAFEVPLPSVAIEETPTGEFNRAIGRIYRFNPLRTVLEFPGPHLYDPRTGIAQIGVYVDQEPILYRLWEPGSGPLHDLISGTTGAGKSSVLNVLLAIERHHGMISVVIDPKQGASLPDWQDSVARYARSAEEGVQVLLEMEREMRRRNKLLGALGWDDERGRRRKGVSFFDPTVEAIIATGLRMLVITIDEAHQVLEYQEAVRAAEAISKIGRSVGMKLRLVTQVPLVDQIGGSSTLKEMVRSGNVIVLRTGSRLSGEVAFSGELPVDPVQLPRTWPDGSSTAGLCFAVGVQARTAQGRLFHPGDSFGWAHRGSTVRLEPPGDAAQVPAAGGLYVPWDLAGEQAPEVDQPAPEGNGAAATPQGTAQERCVAFLADRGPDGASVGVIATQLGMPMSTAGTALKQAQQAGQVVHPRERGPWVIADA